jgi:hypothetical protein
MLCDGMLQSVGSEGLNSGTNCIMTQENAMLTFQLINVDFREILEIPKISKPPSRGLYQDISE